MNPGYKPVNNGKIPDNPTTGSDAYIPNDFKYILENRQMIYDLVLLLVSKGIITPEEAKNISSRVVGL